MFLSTSTDSFVKKGVNFSFCVVPSNTQRMVLIAWIPFCGKQCVPGVEDFGKLNWSRSICCLFKEILKKGNKKQEDSVLSPVVCIFFAVTSLLPYCCLMQSRRFRMDTMAIILKQNLIRWQVLLIFHSLTVQQGTIYQYSYSAYKSYISYAREALESIQCVTGYVLGRLFL